MEKRIYKPREQDHDHLVSPQAFSLLFEFFYHSPWWKTEDVPFADKFKDKKKQISSLLNNAKVWRNAILWVEIKNVTKNWHSVKMDEAQCWKMDNNFSSRVILFLCSKFQMIHWLMQSEQPMLIMVIYFKYMYINVQYMHVHSFFLSWLLKPSYIPVSSIWYYKL